MSRCHHYHHHRCHRSRNWKGRCHFRWFRKEPLELRSSNRASSKPWKGWRMDKHCNGSNLSKRRRRRQRKKPRNGRGSKLVRSSSTTVATHLHLHHSNLLALPQAGIQAAAQATTTLSDTARCGLHRTTHRRNHRWMDVHHRSVDGWHVGTLLGRLK